MSRGPTEDAWQRQVLDIATAYGWWAHHEYDSRRGTSGLPDLILLRAPRLVFAELKTNTGRVRPEQRQVMTDLAASGVEVGLWRPRDLSTVLAVLGPKGARATLPVDWVTASVHQ